MELYRNLGWFSIAFAWTVLVILIIKWPREVGKSFSTHAAASRKTYLLMGVMQSIAVPMFFIFALKWFVPTLRLPEIFLYFLGYSSAGILFAAWVPDVSGLKGRLHRGVAYSAAVAFIPATLILGLSQNVSVPARALSFVTVTYMVAALYSFFFTMQTKNYYLYIQGIYIFLFHITILVAAYI